MTEDDVIAKVEAAESLWKEALEKRKTANALSDKAKEEAEAAANSVKDASENIIKGNAISLEKVQAADDATRLNIDAGSMVVRAFDACEEAEKCKLEAEGALQASEKALEQHLIDFPESSLKE